MDWADCFSVAQNRSYTIITVHSSRCFAIENDSSATNINHQILNGVYRTVQLLEVIAYESIPGTVTLDTNSTQVDKDDVDMTPNSDVDSDL